MSHALKRAASNAEAMLNIYGCPSDQPGSSYMSSLKQCEGTDCDRKIQKLSTSLRELIDSTHSHHEKLDTLEKQNNRLSTKNSKLTGNIAQRDHQIWLNGVKFDQQKRDLESQLQTARIEFQRERSSRLIAVSESAYKIDPIFLLVLATVFATTVWMMFPRRHDSWL